MGTELLFLAVLATLAAADFVDYLAEVFGGLEP